MAVRKWLESRVGRWEVKGGLKADQVGRTESELVAGGMALLSRGTTGNGDTFVSVDAWESDKNKLVTTFYLSNGSYIRREQDVKENGISGSVHGVDADGKAFGGRFAEKMTNDGSSESIYEGTFAGNKVTLKWTIKKLSR